MGKNGLDKRARNHTQTYVHLCYDLYEVWRLTDPHIYTRVLRLLFVSAMRRKMMDFRTQTTFIRLALIRIKTFVNVNGIFDFYSITLMSDRDLPATRRSQIVWYVVSVV